MEFTADQKEALRIFNEFDSSDSSYRCFILKGYAGTGKTTLISHLVGVFKEEKRKIKLIAPTGRAAKVMSSYANFPSATIHKLIYYMSDSVEGSSLILAKNLYKHTLFVVDEASMVGIESSNSEGSLLQDLLNYVFSGEGCSLMLVGDPGQLPPVGQTDSPALRKDFLAHHYSAIRVFEHTLTEVVRQAAHSQITTNATFLRSIQVPQPPYFSKVGKDVLRINGSELLDALEVARSEGDESFVMLTISNKRAGQWNHEIRNRLFQYEESLVRGEWLMVVKNNYFWAADSEMGLIANGELMNIVRIVREEHLYGFDFIHVAATFFSEPSKERNVICFKETLSADAPNLSRDRLRTLFFEIEKDYPGERNKRKRYQLILKNPYFNALQIKYAYCITAHKAQGGQWETVFVDYGFIPENMEKKEYIRWLYTCVTRSKTSLYLLNFPDDYFEQ
jgi:exodeoxyribonuclease-5